MKLKKAAAAAVVAATIATGFIVSNGAVKAASRNHTLSISDATSKEGKDLGFVVTLNPPALNLFSSKETVKVQYITESNGTSDPGDDYQPKLGTLTFEPGESTKILNVPTVADGISEPDETMYIDLVDASLSCTKYGVPTPCATTLSVFDGQGKGTILDGGGIMAVNPIQVHYTDHAVGTRSAKQPATISNVGNGHLRVGALTVYDDLGEFPITGTRCENIVLAPQETCSVQVAFKPAAIGLRGATFVWAADDGDSPSNHSISFRGTGLAAAANTAALETTISSAPAPKIGRTQPATYTFTSSDAAATFECSLDGADFAACTSPLTLTGLAKGSHTFRVRAVSGGTADQTPASNTFKVKKR